MTMHAKRRYNILSDRISQKLIKTFTEYLMFTNIKAFTEYLASA